METNPFTVFKTVLKYTVFILASPILTFFICKLILFEGIFNMNQITSGITSAILAVIVLHIAVGMYIHRAYFEAEKVKEQ